MISKNEFFIIEGLALDLKTGEYHSNQAIRMPYYHRHEIDESVAIHIKNKWKLTGESSAGD